jgi:hypothetical protein
MKYLFLCSVGDEPRAWCMLGKRPITEPHPQTCMKYFKQFWHQVTVSYYDILI